MNDTTCTGAIFIYKVTLDNGYGLPGFINFDYNSFLFSWAAVPYFSVGLYPIKVNAYLNNG